MSPNGRGGFEELQQLLRERVVEAQKKSQDLIDEIDARTRVGAASTGEDLAEQVYDSPKRKPPLPEQPWEAFPRIELGEHRLDINKIVKLAVFTADDYHYAAPAGATAADVRAGGVREAILHLLELGLIDIDSQRLRAADGFPTGRGLRR